MRLQADRVKIRVPGTAADFGSTRGCLAAALNIFEEMSIRAIAGGDTVRLIDRTPVGRLERWLGAEEVATHPAIEAIHRVLDEVGAPQVGIHLTHRQGVPPDAGLGEVEAQALAGAFGAWALLGRPEGLPEAALTQVVEGLGGTIPRIRASLAGALALILPLDEDDTAALRLPPAPRLNPVALVPQEAAPVLGGQEVAVSTELLAAASARAAALVSLLSSPPPGEEGEGEVAWQQMLLAATRDELPPARDAGSASVALVKWLQERGLPSFISGEGPAVVSLWPVGEKIAEAARAAGWTVVPAGFSGEGLATAV